MLTCERGRESKCKRDGFEILQHYLSQQKQQSPDADTSDNKKLSLEQEIAMFQQEQSESNKAFQVYETGCGGTVFLMCTLPNSALIPPIRTEWKETHDANRAAEATTVDSCNNADEKGDNAKKRARIEGSDTVASTATNSKGPTSNEAPEARESTDTTPSPLQFDPVETVQRVFQDVSSSSNPAAAPSSRFVTRMIPIQATCFTSLEEIQLTAKALVEKYLSDVTPPSTFAIQIKRRNCSNVSRDDVITAVAGAVDEKWKVNLKSPDYTILVEICKTLCGMAIVKDCEAVFGNFNLLELREAKEQQVNDSD